ncbi:hypothetical protein [Tunturiibacter gelidoferens]|uniref:Uncharacterized protein n=1 Tax=Tunturiibacter lichenicola TaxID=2051959 RepID=A0A7Y9T9M4_9BACT|nr:hypothetical protein [Edaphobacter lichenicola]NYF51510.1 hypothetical protein [Edaphobacter lichenicola]
MGVTIHYQGRLKDEMAYGTVRDIATVFAKKHAWPLETISESKKHLERVIEEESILYDGPVYGIKLNPHPYCEPFTLEFDASLYCQDYTKTQFAGPDIHIALIDLIEELKPHFVEFILVDESDYWPNFDEASLLGSFRRIDEVIANLRDENPGSKYMVRTPDGRFIDFIG